MADYVKVKSVGVVINGKPAGSIVEMTETEAKHYEALGYVELLPAKSTGAKKESAPKKSPKAKPEKKTEG